MAECRKFPRRYLKYCGVFLPATVSASGATVLRPIWCPAVVRTQADEAAVSSRCGFRILRHIEDVNSFCLLCIVQRQKSFALHVSRRRRAACWPSDEPEIVAGSPSTVCTGKSTRRHVRCPSAWQLKAVGCVGRGRKLASTLRWRHFRFKLSSKIFRSTSVRLKFCNSSSSTSSIYFWLFRHHVCRMESRQSFTPFKGISNGVEGQEIPASVHDPHRQLFNLIPGRTQINDMWTRWCQSSLTEPSIDDLMF